MLAGDATAFSVLAALVSGCLWGLSAHSPQAPLVSLYNGGAALAAIVSATLAILAIVLKPRIIERKDKSTDALMVIVGRLLRAIESSSPGAYIKAKEELVLITKDNLNNSEFERIAKSMLAAAESPNDINKEPTLPRP